MIFFLVPFCHWNGQLLQVSFAEHEKKIAAGEVDGEDFMTEYMLEMKKCEDEASPMFYKGSE